MSNKSSIVAVVPMKSLAESKTRLSPHLSPAQRSALSLSMFSWVVQTLAESRIARVIVVGGDSAVQAEAARGGAEWVKDEFLDLNKAISRVFDAVWEDGMSAAYVPADLPLLTPSDVDRMIEASEDGRFLTLCRAHDGGTNGLIAPPGVGFHTRLGANSFRKHQAVARELGIELRVCHSDGFSRDVDTIEDLRFCMEKRPPCLEVVSDLFKDVNK